MAFDPVPAQVIQTSPASAVALAAMAGNREAVRVVWQENRRWIAAVLLAYKPRHADLEDLLQEVALSLVNKISTLRDAASLRAWLRTVAINAARAAARPVKAGRLQATLAADDEPAGDTGAPSSNEEVSQVMRAVADLPEMYREPLLLKAVHGLRTRHVADILGIEEAAVDTRVSRARRMLREKLQSIESGSGSARGDVALTSERAAALPELSMQGVRES